MITEWCYENLFRNYQNLSKKKQGFLTSLVMERAVSWRILSEVGVWTCPSDVFLFGFVGVTG